MSRPVEEVIAGSPLPGYQLGGWKLNLGYGAVGTLAFARTPRYAKSKAGSEGEVEKLRQWSLPARTLEERGIEYVGSVGSVIRK